MQTVPVWSADPRTGEQRAQVAVEAGPPDVDRAVRAAAAAEPALADRALRAALLRAAAERLESAAEEVIATADAETALGVPRLTGELARTTYQLRAFADIVDEGAFLDVVIDHADPALARPDLRRMKLPLGVVAVFSASNFPLAFSVPGGDTASALAAGCPVVVKAHPDHPATGELCAGLIREAARAIGVPEGVLGLVHGLEAGLELVRHPLTAAVGFTGSVRGGRALHDVAAARPRPIPFHGELGSLNPVLVTERAAATRAEELGAGLAGSFTLGNGQFCVKPGLVLVPAGEPALEKALVAAAGQAPAGPLLDPRIREAFLAGVEQRSAFPGVEVLLAAGSAPVEGAPLAVRAGVLAVAAAELREELLEECFGPLTVLVRYSGTEELAAVLDRLAGNLTATVQLAADERGPEAAALLQRLVPLAGRLVVDGWPTGVAVAPAMHHGGPYPATTSTSTSVGGTAIERWLRPVSYQNGPPELLPPELHDANPLAVPRRVDGRRES
ncbi:aldehyde dehydrogenase (NADP(+)) [Kitasatospora atroaurantiaca]|uniref:aldehyde dehydrogenase (NADP(+)) n=1 Tax=Kitasatospora atroaurantiaca TaxID=285545 RepID=UPI0011AA5BDB|nr:aldehyde dehydrogenase (NADP(+)) [Kitasatospora atroaurantiaca]